MIFTFHYFKDLIGHLRDHGYRVITLSDFDPHASKQIIMRHDVDLRPVQALAFARMESEMDIRSTYFFRTVQHVFKADIIREVSGLGHEIGYHYEDLSTKRGDYEHAIQSFKKHLSALRQLAPVRSIAKHGAALSPYDNQDLWEKYKYRDFDIEFDAYDHIRFKDTIYATDTGMTWKSSPYNIRDHIKDTIVPDIDDDREISEYLISSGKNIYFQIHPSGWAKNFLDVALCAGTEMIIRARKRLFRKRS